MYKGKIKQEQKLLSRREFAAISSGLIGVALASQISSDSLFAAATSNYVSDLQLPLKENLFKTQAESASALGTSFKDKPYITVPIETSETFNLFALSFQKSVVKPQVMFRTFYKNHWSGWTSLHNNNEHLANQNSYEFQLIKDKKRIFSEPIWCGKSTKVQLATNVKPKNCELHFINSKKKDSLSYLSFRKKHPLATTQSYRPLIIPRLAWNITKQLPRTPNKYGQVKLAFVHHTVSVNDYSPWESSAIVRGIYHYHRNVQGWNDIGYNFLVDKYGQIFEGRAGGIRSAVIGSQAQGYNNFSTGIATIGNFVDEPYSNNYALNILANLIAWKLAIHNINPRGNIKVISRGGPLNRYPNGKEVVLNKISAHRDGDKTTCPGDALYKQMPQLRELVYQLS